MTYYRHTRKSSSPAQAGKLGRRVVRTVARRRHDTGDRRHAAIRRGWASVRRRAAEGPISPTRPASMRLLPAIELRCCWSRLMIVGGSALETCRRTAVSAAKANVKIEQFALHPRSAIRASETAGAAAARARIIERAIEATGIDYVSSAMRSTWRISCRRCRRLWPRVSGVRERGGRAAAPTFRARIAPAWPSAALVGGPKGKRIIDVARMLDR